MSPESIDLSDRSHNVYLDTSIYNQILDDPEADFIKKKLKEKSLIVIPSIVNLCESIVTSSPERKRALLSLYNELRNNFFPLKPDTYLLRDSAAAVERNEREWEINFPIVINTETEQICRELRRQSRGAMRPQLEGARNFIQNSAESERSLTDIQFFAYLDSDRATRFLVCLFHSLCRMTGIVSHLTIEQIASLARNPHMPWKYFIESTVYYFYRYSYPAHGFGARSLPGGLDLDQCAYLFWPRYFVVEDAGFLNFVRDLKRIRKYEIELLDYQEFKLVLASS